MHRATWSRPLAVLLVCAMLLLGPAAGASAAGPTAQLRLAPAVSEIEVGDVVALDVRVEDVADLYGYQVYLDYDPALLQAVDENGQPAASVTLGAFLNPDLVLTNAVDAAAGRVSVVVSNMGSPAVSGSGVLFTLRFRGSARGAASVVLDDDANDSILADTEGMAIPYAPEDATLYVGVQAPAPQARLCLPLVVGGAR